MEEINLIFICECCGEKRCCNIDGYVRTCSRCHLWGFMCQSEIDCDPKIKGECEDCVRNLFDENIVREEHLCLSVQFINAGYAT